MHQLETTGQSPLRQPAYLAAEAARLVGLSSGRVHRWLQGYSYAYRDERRRQEPVIRHSGGSSYASFLDLVDLLFVRRFLDHGISLQTLRKALEEAREILGTDHFARQRFFTDGRGVFLAVKESAKADEGEAMMKLLSGGQWVIPDVIKALADEIEFDSSTDLAQRWYPPDADRRVVVDPAVSFGSPSVAGTGITTANVYDLYVAEGRKIGPVRRWFGLETDCIEAAICFEERMAA